MAQPFTLDVQSGIADFLKRIDDRQKNQVPFVTAVALTKTAQDIKDEEVEVIARVFDRPTRFTLNSLYVRPATKSNLTATVEFKEGFGSVPAWRYLGPQVAGGARSHKAGEKRLIAAGLMLPNEFVVPGLGVKLDASGNVPGSLMNQILSSLGARADSQQNSTAKSRKRKGSSRLYLVIRSGVVRPGVYMRKGKRKGYEIIPILMFVRAPHYQQRFPFYETARAVMQRRFAANFRVAWDTYLPGQSVGLGTWAVSQAQAA